MSTKQRQRDEREARALRFLRLRARATALEIGAAAVRGEPRAAKIGMSARQAIGLSIAVSLARRGVVAVERNNTFTALVQPRQQPFSDSSDQSHSGTSL